MDDRESTSDMATTNLSEVIDQLKGMVWAAFISWAFAPVLCRAVKYGKVILVIHDSKLKDVHLDLSASNSQN